MASRNLRIVIRAMQDFVDQVVKKITLDIVANLVRAPSAGGTPVDTGWARSNWIPRVGRGSQTRNARGQFEGDLSGSPDNVSTAKQQAGVAQVATARNIRRSPVSIVNNVPYIGRLNDGSSKQAPRGFVQAAIAKAVTVDIQGLAR